jgi:hypothetical protein
MFLKPASDSILHFSSLKATTYLFDKALLYPTRGWNTAQKNTALSAV